MFKDLFKGILSAIAIKLLENYRHLSVQLLKIESAKSYLHCVQMARLLASGSMWRGLFIALIGMGALLFHAGLFILLPWSLESKAVLCLFLGAVYVVIGTVLLRSALDEKTWMEKSGASDMLEEAIGQSKND